MSKELAEEHLRNICAHDLPDVDLDGLPIDPRHPANAPRRF